MATKLGPTGTKSLVVLLLSAVFAVLGITVGVKAHRRNVNKERLAPVQRDRSRRNQAQPAPVKRKQGKSRRNQAQPAPAKRGRGGLLIASVAVTAVMAALMVSAMKVLPSSGRGVFEGSIAPLIGLLDVVSALIVFLSVIGNMDAKGARRFAYKAVGYCVAIAIIGAVGGPYFLKYMGVPISAFTVVGGYVFWKWGTEEINKPRPKAALPEPEPNLRQRVSDLIKRATRPFQKPALPEESHVGTMTAGEFAFPLVLGPGVISFLISQEGTYGGLYQRLGLALAVAFVLSMLLLGMLLAPLLLKFLGDGARHSLSVIIGYLLMGFSVVMFVGGGVTFLLETLNSPPAIDLIAKIIEGVNQKLSHGG